MGFKSLWDDHPKVRSGSDLTLGERAADVVRQELGSWPFVFGALAFLSAWMLSDGGTLDPFPWILLNLVLSCLAALQGSVLLIAAKRADQISFELAQHDYEIGVESRKILEFIASDMTGKIAEIRNELALMRKNSPAGVIDSPNSASSACRKGSL